MVQHSHPQGHVGTVDRVPFCVKSAGTIAYSGQEKKSRKLGETISGFTDSKKLSHLRFFFAPR